MGIVMTQDMAEKLTAYHTLLMEANETMNLTRIVDEEEAVSRQYLDSVPAQVLRQIPEGARVVDVGTGAGLPGIPLAILRPDVEMTLMDALQKRVAFLQKTAEALELPLRVIHIRAEDGGRAQEHRERYDVAVARAVAPMAALAEYLLPLVKVGGKALCYKGPKGGQELDAAREGIGLLGGRAMDILPVRDPFFERNCSIIVLQKNYKTPIKYPRNSGVIKKSPLIASNLRISRSK
ncbi:16S rRNA (guanine(527)-N(7))-methyltransferase RsmG [Gehongia tenuis]|uniref:Ribosomal RNA small subunit methyltransferase G n=1 Tax=Gehongia tenuis TaxID=2763655 RepID=A0A926D5E4_9FIRM|nr:16S rRNA (guanine(527)-N(7))-methyltransferase RsmG [Gehongia tenuis]MBC8532058.1 16S rRNA (guanine(527)-N(7))-methyltransferase RsmG [Gehongia tenuis]